MGRGVEGVPEGASMMNKPTQTKSAPSDEWASARYAKLCGVLRLYGWEGGKEVPVALALYELLQRPSLPLAKLAAIAREAL